MKMGWLLVILLVGCGGETLPASIESDGEVPVVRASSARLPPKPVDATDPADSRIKACHISIQLIVAMPSRDAKVLIHFSYPHTGEVPVWSYT